MAHTLKYPYTEEERTNFIVEYNHNQGLRIETIDNFVELEVDEIEIIENDYGETVEEITGKKTESVNMPTHFALEPWELLQGDEVIDNTEAWEQEQAQKEKERIALLSLTRGDVFRGLLLARGVTRLMLRGMIETNEQLTEVQKEMALIDFDEALNFYRGNALIDTVGLALGIESAQLDKFFETNDYTVLLPVEEEQPAEV